MLDSLHRYFWEDLRVRGYVYVGSIFSTVLCAIVRTTVFHKAEPRVAVEMLVCLLIFNLAAILIYCFRQVAFAPLHYSFPTWLRYGGAVACIVLLAAPQVSISTVQAAIVNQRLERATVSIESDKTVKLPDEQLETRFRKISSIVSTSLVYKIPANPEVVANMQTNLQATLNVIQPRDKEVRNSGVSAFVAVVAYARVNNLLLTVNVPTVLLGHGQTGNMMISQVPLKNGAAWWQASPEGNAIFAIPRADLQPVFPISNSTVVFNGINFRGFGRPFIGTDKKSQVIVSNATIEGARQVLDSVVWLNVKFRGSEITYNGGPLYLGNVTLENCQFRSGTNPESQKVIEEIKKAGSEAVNLVSGLNQ
jgi:hypothetical protein